MSDAWQAVKKLLRNLNQEATRADKCLLRLWDNRSKATWWPTICVAVIRQTIFWFIKLTQFSLWHTECTWKIKDVEKISERWAFRAEQSENCILRKHLNSSTEFIKFENLLIFGERSTESQRIRFSERGTTAIQFVHILMHILMHLRMLIRMHILVVYKRTG